MEVEIPFIQVTLGRESYRNRLFELIWNSVSLLTGPEYSGASTEKPRHTAVTVNVMLKDADAWSK